MKSLVITCVLVVVMLAIITVNFFCLHHITSEMATRTEHLPAISDPSCVLEVQALNEDWLARAELLTLSVPFPTVDRISEQLATLSACANCGDVFGYQTALALLTDAIEDMQRYRF